MQLSADLFRRIVETLHSDEGICSRHEERSEGRVGVRCWVEVTPCILDDPGRKTVRVTVRDISSSGMGFIAHDQMAVGAELNCKLPFANNTSIEVVMTVRHCAKISKGLYIVGVSFDRAAVRSKLSSTGKTPVEIPAAAASPVR
jgi:hypothetical protein